MRSNLIGVYILEEINGSSSYVGGSICLQSRIRNHRNELKRGVNNSIKLQEAYNQGARFKFRVLLLCRKTELKFYEQLVLDKFKPDLNTFSESDHKNLIGPKNPMYKKSRPDLTSYNKNRVNPNKGKKMLGTAYASFMRGVVYWGA